MALSRIYIETSILIDAIKDSIGETIESDRQNDVWYTKQCLLAAEAGEIEIITLTLTIAECRRAISDKPANEETKRLINSILTSGKVILLAEVTQNIAERARDLDWVHGIHMKGADSIHVATAITTGCKEIFTRDKNDLLKNASKLSTQGLRVLRPSDTQLLPPEYKYKQGKLLTKN